MNSVTTPPRNTLIMPKALTRGVKFRTVITCGHQQFAALDEEGNLWLGALDLTDLVNPQPITWLKANMPQANIEQQQTDVEVES